MLQDYVTLWKKQFIICVTLKLPNKNKKGKKLIQLKLPIC